MVLVILGFLGNYLQIDLPFGIGFIFGSIAVLIVVNFYGVVPGTLAALLASSCTYFLWGHPLAIVMLTLEALFVGLLIRTGRKNLLILDGIYWLCIGMPMGWVLYSTMLEMDAVTASLTMLKQSVNGVSNALLASLLINNLPVRQYLEPKPGAVTLPLHEKLFSLLVALVLFPALVILFLESREQMKRIDSQTVAELQELSGELASHLRYWHQTHVNAVTQLAICAQEASMTTSSELQRDTEVIKKAFPDLHHMYVADSEGTTIAFYPPVNERGESTIGINFSDRPYFKKLQKARQPVLSEVFMGRGGVFSPIVTLSVPILIGDRFAGYALGALDLKQIGKFIIAHRREYGYHLTLVDSEDRIIVSTLPDRVPMQHFEGRKGGTSSSIDESVLHWLPTNENIPSIARWRNSYYIGETIIRPDIPWRLIVEIQGAPKQQYLFTLYLRSLSIMALLTLLALPLAVLFSRWIARPLAGLVNVTTDLPNKLTDHHGMDWPHSSTTEIHLLVSNFEFMAAALEKNFQELQERSVELEKTNEELKVRIDERRRAEDAYRESEMRYRELADLLPQPVYEIDEKAHFSFANRAALNIFGYTPDDLAGGLHALDILAPEDREKAMENIGRRLAGEDVGGIEYTAVKKDGSRFPVILYSSPIVRGNRSMGLRGIVVDITHRKKMENEVLKAQKLESLGVLAGGIAHDFNNILTAIMGNISLARMYTQPEDPIAQRLQEAEKSTIRARELTLQLLTFSKGGAPLKKTVSVSEVILDSARFALRGSNVLCEFSLAEGLWPVEVDTGQFSLVVQNLIMNAAQAMPEGGRVEVSAENFTIHSVRTVPLLPGKYIRVSIRDHGVGIEEEHLSKIFDPYFTTDPSRSGLGLATAYSIIHRHGGYLTAESELGSGTTFTIYLPFSEKDMPAARDAEAPLPTGKRRILVMDDDEVVRDVSGQMLELMGYEVEFAGDGLEAMALYSKAQESGKPFDVVIMDLTIPGGMGGKEAIQKLLEMDPQVKAIVSSGYSNDPVMSRFQEFGFKGVVAKPYRIEDLGHALAEVINGKKDEPA